MGGDQTGERWDDNERATLVALLRMQPEKLKWHEICDLVAERGSATEVWHSYFPGTLFDDDEPSQTLREAMGDYLSWKSEKFEFHTFMDSTYPEQLRSVHQMPPILFTEGHRVEHDLAVSVVGSRNASDAGLKFASDVARMLVHYDVTVVAGLAEGIDTAAHASALEAGGRTVAVLGNGISRQYPRSNSGLQRAIAKSGMLISQFMPDFSPTRWSFPARNATMSAYGIATVVVEANERSGTRIQAREAIAHGRPVVLSESVVRSTAWARKLQGQPGVYVAATATQAVAHIERIIDDEQIAVGLISGAPW